MIPQAHFGWSRRQPPDPDRYLLPATVAFIDRQTTENGTVTFVPTEKLVERVLREVTDPEASRFAVLTGLVDVWKMTGEQVYAFQKRLMEKICASTGLQLARPTPTVLQGRKDDGFHSYKPFHFDVGGKAPIFSLTYGPFQGLGKEEGLPRLADLNQWVRDNTAHALKLFKKAGIKQPVTREGMVQILNRLPADHPIQQELAKTHAIELRDIDFEHDMPIVIINNSYRDGIAHGATGFSPGFSPHGKARPIHRMLTTAKEG